MNNEMKHLKTDEHLNLIYSKNRNVLKAYIIHLPNNLTSQKYAKKCVESCESVGQPYEMFEGFDGTGSQIITPEHMRSENWLKCIKVTNHHLSQGEVACFLSHVSLWMKCIQEDRPIVILEHDAAMLSPFTDFMAYNNIVYLGSKEQYMDGWKVLPIPMHASLNINYLFIGRAHAYAIDPQIAKNMISRVFAEGISESLDIWLRADTFGMVQLGLFAYDQVNEFGDKDTTILERKGDIPINNETEIKYS
jgi:hypothetical protein